ncbi:MAG: SRPBCC family protein [Sphingobacteriaceae bacterium]
MKTYQLKFEQTLPITMEQAWDFFSSPLNLAKITPAHMSFVITSDFKEGQKMYPGMIITYKLSPLAGVKINWMTEITHVKDGEYFIDEQRFGPYALWHHQHHFKEVPGGVHMTDILNYAIPYGFIGRIANRVFVAKEVQSIFAHREKAVEKLFGKYKG